MARQYINLTFTINVSTTHSDEYLPVNLEVTETITLQFPSVDPKYTVPPAKLVEGVTERVITEHRARVRDYLDQKAEQDKEERQIGLWATPNVTLTHEGDTLIIGKPMIVPDGTLLAGVGDEGASNE